MEDEVAIPQGLFLWGKGVTMRKSWYEIKAQGEDEVEVIIYDEIGIWGITAKDFIDDFKKIPPTATINLRINSRGGDVFDGLAIHNILKRHSGQINVTVDGIAASIASLIAMAGDKIVMPENTFMMIHDPLGFAFGDAEDMRELAENLDKIKSGLVSSYVAKSGQEPEKISELMADETWLTAKEAKDLGFADEVIAAVRLAARADLHRFKQPPDALKAMAGSQDPAHTSPAPGDLEAERLRVEAYEEMKAAAIEKGKAESLLILDLCTKAGISDAAVDFINQGMTPDQAREHLIDAPAIRIACNLAEVPDLADSYIKAGNKINQVRSQLNVIITARDVEINNKLGPEENGQSAKPAIDVTEIYAYRRSVSAK